MTKIILIHSPAYPGYNRMPKEGLCGVPLKDHADVSYHADIEDIANIYSYLENLDNAAAVYRACPECVNHTDYVMRLLDNTEL